MRDYWIEKQRGPESEEWHENTSLVFNRALALKFCPDDFRIHKLLMKNVPREPKPIKPHGLETCRVPRGGTGKNVSKGLARSFGVDRIKA
jgi:hypothetical protein